MDTCKFCGMDQHAATTNQYRQPYAPAEEPDRIKPPVFSTPLPKKKILSPKLKSALAYVTNILIGASGIALLFPGLTYLGRAMWPLLFGHSINAVQDQVVHYVCTWSLGACMLFSPILFYWAGLGMAAIGGLMKDFVKDKVS